MQSIKSQHVPGCKDTASKNKCNSGLKSSSFDARHPGAESPPFFFSSWTFGNFSNRPDSFLRACKVGLAPLTSECMLKIGSEVKLQYIRRFFLLQASNSQLCELRIDYLIEDGWGPQWRPESAEIFISGNILWPSGSSQIFLYFC